VGARFRFRRPSSSVSLGGAVEVGGTKGPFRNDRLIIISSGGDGARDRGGGASGDFITKVIGRGGVLRTIVISSSFLSLSLFSSLSLSSSLLGVTVVLFFKLSYYAFYAF
jgi:hypothetical protein